MTSRFYSQAYQQSREPATSCATWMIVFFSNLSATTPPKRGIVSHGHGYAQVDDAEDGRRAGDVIYEVALGEHLHLRPCHEEQHPDPQKEEVTIGE